MHRRLLLWLKWGIPAKTLLFQLQLLFTALLLFTVIVVSFNSKDVLTGELSKALSILLALHIFKLLSKP